MILCTMHIGNNYIMDIYILAGKINVCGGGGVPQDI